MALHFQNLSSNMQQSIIPQDSVSNAGRSSTRSIGSMSISSAARARAIAKKAALQAEAKEITRGRRVETEAKKERDGVKTMMAKAKAEEEAYTTLEEQGVPAFQ